MAITTWAATSSGAFLYSGGAVTDLGAFESRAINSGGVVVGATGPFDQACIYSGGTLTNLVVPGGFPESHAIALNDNGQVLVSASGSLFGTQYAFLYNSDGTWTSLGSFGAGGMNGAGDVVGATGYMVGSNDAVLYSNGTLADLNTLIDPSSGWHLSSAAAINDNGWIVGDGVNPSGQQEAFLLIPTTVTPEPSTLVLACVGIFGITCRLLLRRWR